MVETVISISEKLQKLNNWQIIEEILLEKRKEIVDNGHVNCGVSYDYSCGRFHGQIELIEDLLGKHICDWMHREDEVLPSKETLLRGFSKLPEHEHNHLGYRCAKSKCRIGE